MRKFTHARLKHWAHHTENKLCVFNPAQRWQRGGLKETELFWLYTFLLAPYVHINPVGRSGPEDRKGRSRGQEGAFLRAAKVCAQHARHSIYWRRKRGWVNLTKLFMALMTLYKSFSLPFETWSHFVAWDLLEGYNSSCPVFLSFLKSCQHMIITPEAKVPSTGSNWS